MVRVVPIVMWVNNVTLTALFLIISFFAKGQVNLFPRHSENKSWVITIAPDISHSRHPSGYAIVYPGEPVYVGLKLLEPHLLAYHAEVSRQNQFRKNWNISRGIGFSRYSFSQHLHYNKEASQGTALSYRYDHNYVYGKMSMGRAFKVEKISIQPYAAVTLNYLLSAEFTHTHETGSARFNYTRNHKPWAVGWSFGALLGYQVTDKLDIGLRPAFTKIERKYRTEIGDRVVYSYSVGIFVGLKLARKD